VVEVVAVGDAGPEFFTALHRPRTLVGTEMNVGAVQ
jgi:hypothetical protein